MPIEVEFKVQIDDIGEIEYQLIEKKALLVEITVEKDQYFTHPSKKFHKTDEALRIRESGNKIFLTYKGPKLDHISKARIEIETMIIDRDKITQILECLGFQKTLVVIKERKKYLYNNALISLDFIETLGNFLEIEQEADNTTEYKKVQAKLLKILNELGLEKKNYIRESYLELLLAKSQK